MIKYEKNKESLKNAQNEKIENVAGLVLIEPEHVR
jgi:hypothetical protein